MGFVWNAEKWGKGKGGVDNLGGVQSQGVSRFSYIVVGQYSMHLLLTKTCAYECISVNHFILLSEWFHMTINIHGIHTKYWTFISV